MEWRSPQSVSFSTASRAAIGNREPPEVERRTLLKPSMAGAVNRLLIVLVALALIFASVVWAQLLRGFH